MRRAKKLEGTAVSCGAGHTRDFSSSESIKITDTTVLNDLEGNVEAVPVAPLPTVLSSIFNPYAV